MKVLHPIIFTLLTLVCASAQPYVQTAHLELIGQPIPEIRHMNDMKVLGDTLYFVYEGADGFGQRILRRAAIDRPNDQLAIGPEIGKQDDGYYVAYLPYPFVGVDDKMYVVGQDDGRIYIVTNDSMLVQTKTCLFNADVPLQISQYVQDVFTVSPGKYVFVGHGPKGGTQYAMSADIASARIDTVSQIRVSPMLTAWMPNAGELAYSSKHNRLVFAYRLHPVIDILGMDGTIITALRIGSDTFDPATLDKADFEDLNPLHFVDISTTDDYIFALHWGHRYGEAPTSTIYRLDWDGSIVDCYSTELFYRIAAINDRLLIGWNGEDFVLIQL